jgi:hypothetical protein
LELHDVFDAGATVGPRDINDLSLRSPLSPDGPVNCYGDNITDFRDLGCNDVTYTCTYQIVTQTQCRTLTPDGEAFNLCSYAPTGSRILDMEGDLPYPVELDGLHTVFANVYECDASNQCQLANQSPFGYPDQIQTTIISSNYLAQSIETNPFRVAGGFLPTPFSTLSSFNQLTDTVSPQGSPKRFDGNIFSNQPVTISVVLPPEIRTTYDLRLQLSSGNITIYPLNQVGARLGTSGTFNGTAYDTTGYTGRASLDFSDIALATLFTPKNAYDDGCGAQLTCQKLSACNNIIGCDGFSVPVSQLRALMDANGYEFALTYKIGLTNPDGSPPNARSLLSMQEDDGPVFELNSPALMRHLLQTTANPGRTYIGAVYFTVSVDDAGNITIEQSTTGAGLGLYTDDIPYKYTANQVFQMVDVTIILISVVLYPLISQVSKKMSDKDL